MKTDIYWQRLCGLRCLRPSDGEPPPRTASIPALSLAAGRLLLSCLLVGIVVFGPDLSLGQSIEELQKGVVKITVQIDGQQKVGTGFIVQLVDNVAYIVTAAHVVEGDPNPQVEFFTKRDRPIPAGIVGLEGGDALRGLALLVVRRDVPQGVRALPLRMEETVEAGKDVIMIGFPRMAGPWHVTKGTIGSRQGRDLFFSPAVDEGHSGGPMLTAGTVVGLVEAKSGIGRGLTAKSVQTYIEGFGISGQGNEPQQQVRESTGQDGAPMVLIHAGEFWMGSTPAEVDQTIEACIRELKRDRKTCRRLFNDEAPKHRVQLDAFFLDQYEVTTERYGAFLQETKRAAPGYWSDKVLMQHARKPVVGVEWDDATAYCAWAGKRLPTEAEWEKAARGTDQRTYHWGNDPPNDRLANYGHCCDFKDYGALTDVGTFEGGKSPYGAYDLAGNVWEWVADWYEAEYYASSPKRNPKGPATGDFRVLRGGSWSDAPIAVRSANRVRHDPTFRLDDIGFRCAQDIPK